VPYAFCCSAGSCGGDGGGPRLGSVRRHLHLDTFRVYIPPRDEATVPSIASAVEREYTRNLTTARGGMPTVTVTLYTDHAALEAAVRPIVGAVPSFASGLVTSQARST
jgi:hypothetical protein